MTDYTELVKELRFGAEYGCDADLIERAADVIEGLVADLGDADAMTEMWMKKYEALHTGRNGDPGSEKLYQVKMNSSGAPDFSTAIEVHMTWKNVPEGLYFVRDGIAHRMEVRSPEGNVVKIPKITLEEPMEGEDGEV